MNICGFSRVNYWHGIKGGMDLHGRLLSEGIAEQGHSVSIISTQHPHGTNYEEKNRVKIYYLENTVFGSRRNGWKKESVSKFIELNRQQPFDVIWSQSFDAFGITSFDKNSLKIPVIPTLHGSIEQEARTFRANLLTRIAKPQEIIKSFAGLLFSYIIAQRPLLSFSEKIIVVSNQVTEDIRKWYGPKIAKKCITILNGVDPSLFKPNREQRATIRRKYAIDDNEILLLTLGRLTHEKGHHLAVKALKQLINKGMHLKLLVVGDGKERGILQEMIFSDRIERDVIFTGQVDNRETVQYYNSADIFLMPTLTVEGLPFVLLEAMSCAKPVIASRMGGNTTVIEDTRNGLLVGPGKVDQLAERVRLLVNNQSLAKRISKEARETVLKRFSVDQMVGQTLQVMKEATNQILS